MNARIDKSLLTAGALGAALGAVLLPTGCGVASSPVVGPPATSAPISVPISVPGD